MLIKINFIKVKFKKKKKEKNDTYVINIHSPIKCVKYKIFI